MDIKFNTVLAGLITLSSSVFASDDELLTKSRSDSHSSGGSTALTSTESPHSHESFISHASREESSPRSNFLSEEALTDLRDEAIIDPTTLDLFKDAKYAKAWILNMHKKEIVALAKKDILGVLGIASYYVSGESFLKQNILTGVGLYKWVAVQNLGDDWHWQIHAMGHLRDISKENGYEKAIEYWEKRIDKTSEAHSEELDAYSKELERLLLANDAIKSE